MPHRTAPYRFMAQPPDYLLPALALLPKNTLFLDAESQKSAQEVGGWRNIPDMLMSVAVTWHAGSRRFSYFYPKYPHALAFELLTADLIIGHNLLAFDLKLLDRYIVQAIKAACKGDGRTPVQRFLRQFGYSRARYWEVAGVQFIDTLTSLEHATGRKLGLDSLAQATLKAPKSGHGLDAIKWYREEQFTKLYAYCAQDVALTRDLFLHGLTYGTVKTKGPLTISVDWKREVGATKEKLHLTRS